MNGWGTFLVPIKVIYKSGTPRYLKHMLVFESKPVDKPLKISADNTSFLFDRSQWEWTVHICGTSEDLDQIKLVQYSLPPLFAEAYAEGVHEVFDRASGRRGFGLSGIGKEEFDIKIRVFYKSGRYQDLRYHVKFYE
jgi:transcription initiation factor IIF auxiliary subunit